MFNDPLTLIVVIACVAVAGILTWGLGTFGKGGEYNHKNANKIMRYRIGAQFVAVMLIVLFVWLRNSGAN